MGRSSFSGPVMVGPTPLNGATERRGQAVLRQVKRFTFADASFTLELPPNAEIIELIVDVIVAWDSVTSDVLDLGDGNTANQFADNLDLQTQGRVLGTSDVSQLGNYEDIGATNTTLTGTITSAGGSLTVGDARLIVEYTVNEPEQN